ncbi:DUF4369 domain-containing protein [Aquimarina addita]|uniref:DUF4369 domain-containing protein n=2 Tax=Aquimarina addita TaxID=870485 RepID=A0ABP7X8V7_9FLAO
MRLFYTITLILTIFIGCSSPKKGNVSINGTVKGLKKGVLYLQKIQDTVLINIDSVIIEGAPQFTFITEVQEPEIHYLFLDKHDGTPLNDRISFFAEPGEMNINTTLNRFEQDAVITGGENQKQFQEYKKIQKRFNNRDLRLLKEDFEARKQNDEEKLMENDVAYKNLLKQKYLYTINFALFNKKLEVAPYVTVNEVYDANIQYLDTVAKSLSPRVKKSMYGQQLLNLIKKRKAEEIVSAQNDQN